jgi:uncharacterized protein with PIN domain
VGASDPGSGSGEPRFYADAMLGRLARWLRILGYDTRFEPDLQDAELVRRAVAEDRIVVTRDRRLPEERRAPRVVVLRSESLLEQLRELARAVPLGFDAPDAAQRLFRRCPQCNAEVEPARPAEVEGRVPANVLARHATFTRCPRCQRVYWDGGHARRIRARLAPLGSGRGDT